MQERVVIYTDGACSPNPGTGGWAAILLAPERGDRRKELAGAEDDTTNNRMELTAAVRGLETLRYPCAVEVYTDSQYMRHAFTKGWLDRWARQGWLLRSKEPVANVDLWKRLRELTTKHTVTWHWVRGHASDALNNRADELASAACNDLMAELRRERREGVA